MEVESLEMEGEASLYPLTLKQAQLNSFMKLILNLAPECSSKIYTMRPTVEREDACINLEVAPGL